MPGRNKWNQGSARNGNSYWNVGTRLVAWGRLVPQESNTAWTPGHCLENFPELKLLNGMGFR